jgi:hypothetical protein
MNSRHRAAQTRLHPATDHGQVTPTRPLDIDTLPSQPVPWMVVGKGPSITVSQYWAGPLIAVNEAVNYTKRGYVTRFDANVPYPFLPELPPDTIAILFYRLANLYPALLVRTFTWKDIRLRGPQPSAVIAIAIAAKLGATEIRTCGLDALFDNDHSYCPDVANYRNLHPPEFWKGLSTQRRRFAQLPPDILELVYNHDGRPITDVITPDPIIEIDSTRVPLHGIEALLARRRERSRRRQELLDQRERERNPKRR